MLVGEAWGEKEEEARAPFIGASGWILDGILAQVGLTREDCYITNVFNLRPKPSNDVKNLCGIKAEGIHGMPVLQKGKYVLAKYAPELERLYSEIKKVDPNVIIALGATAAWALLHSTGIKAIRGAAAPSHPIVSEQLGRTYKVIPTYHPAAIAREWNLRPVSISDFDKAKRERNSPEIVRPAREIWIYPTIEDLEVYEQKYIINAKRLSADIETAKDQITCIGFAPGHDKAIVIPFFSEAQPDKNYWRTLPDEIAAWDYVRRWCAMKPTVFQNGMYDIQFLWRSYGIPVPLAEEDTMLLHHAWQPELEKGLGFLATIYTDSPSWKYMRRGMKHD